MFAILGAALTISLEKGKAMARLVYFYYHEDIDDNVFTNADLAKVARSHFLVFRGKITYKRLPSFWVIQNLVYQILTFTSCSLLGHSKRVMIALLMCSLNLANVDANSVLATAIWAIFCPWWELWEAFDGFEAFSLLARYFKLAKLGCLSISWSMTAMPYPCDCEHLNTRLNRVDERVMWNGYLTNTAASFGFHAG